MLKFSHISVRPGPRDTTVLMARDNLGNLHTMTIYAQDLDAFIAALQLRKRDIGLDGVALDPAHDGNGGASLAPRGET